MTDWVRKALTRRVHQKGPRGRPQELVLTPRDELVYGVKFAIGMTACLSAVEIAHMAFLGRWNAEVFSGIMLISGTILGIFLGQGGA